MLHTKSVDLEEILMENDELIELSFSLGIIVGRELKDKYGIDMRIKGNVVLFTKDELAKVERAVFNEAGVSQMQFNTDGNIALEKSILND